MTERQRRVCVDLAVVGAGPAGLAASDAAARAGLTVLLIDENARPGGQISRLPFRGEAGHGAGGPARQPHHDVEFWGSTVCLGMPAPLCLAVESAGRGVLVAARAVVVATGATERVYPMPGWTTPGVMTAGAAQTFVKGSGVFPYRRVVVGGTGPLLLATASQLVRSGVRVAAVVEAAGIEAAHGRHAAKLLRGGPVLLQGAGYVATLLRAGVPILTRHGIAAVEGDGSVTGVLLRKLDGDWRFRDGEARTIDCDAVLLNHGFASATDLVSQAGAATSWNERMQTWEPVRDASLRTTVPGLYTVGDCAGIGGHEIAALEGELVGQSVVAELTGRQADPARRRALRRRVRGLRRFREGVDGIFRVGAGAAEWASPQTVVCRCQETTAGEVRAALRSGVDSTAGMKLCTRAGMGLCQGRTCAHVIDAMVGRPDRRVPPRVQFPVRPTSAAVLASLGDPVRP